MLDNRERLECGRELANDLGLLPSMGDSALLPGPLGEGELASLDWFDIALITRTTSLSQPVDSARAAKEREVELRTASYTWSRK